MGQPSEINGNNICEEEKSLCNKVKNVHIGVFFDGTNNNMVQQAHYETFKWKLKAKLWKSGRTVDPLSNSASTQQKESYLNIKNCQNRISEIESEKDALVSVSQQTGVFDIDKYRLLESERIEKLEELEKYQVEAHIDTNSMAKDEQNGYSNVAILHSIINTQNNTEDTLYYNLYIEGSGAKNIANKETSLTQKGLDSLGGLGFGVGVKGVASLVSKACKYIHDYLSPLVSKLDENTKYHFYVFGFSRGSTCGRLFTQLVTRNENDILSCENELLRYYSPNSNNRLNFMERNFLTSAQSGPGIINRKNVTVDFLGIYDTVASIGMLKQIDGSCNPLKDKLENFEGTREWTQTYHYNNASQYGLYINNTGRTLYVFHICAADEYRENFALVNLGSGVNYGSEIIIPGCHSDVGGGYVDYDGTKERVLYRFIPRKNTTTKIVDGKEQPVVKWARTKFNVSESDCKKIGFLNPINPIKPTNEENFAPLTLDGLDSMGWVDKNWNDKNSIIYLDQNKEHPCTLRYADALDSSNSRIKFKKNSLKGYSNIPLRMMLEKYSKEVKFQLFNISLIENLYTVPQDLKDFGYSLIEIAQNIEKGERCWVIAGNDYFSDDYKNLRLKYLHFTASNQLVDWKLSLSLSEVDFGNFGNECNYDEQGKICRIMYQGNSDAQTGPEFALKYLTKDTKDWICNIKKVSCKPIKLFKP